MISQAEISPCGKYRYSLTRIWGGVTVQENLIQRVIDRPVKMIAFIGMNPSTADATVNDNTIRKEISFAQLWGYDGLVKFNMFPWRETSPQKLYAAWENFSGPSIAGEWSIARLVTAIKQSGAENAVCAWGRHSRVRLNEIMRQRGLSFAELAHNTGINLKCLGKNNDGSPKHTLYLRLDSTLEVWP